MKKAPHLNYVAFWFLSINYDYEQLIVLKKFAAMAKFENMIIGGIGAILLKNKLKTLGLSTKAILTDKDPKDYTKEQTEELL